MTSRLPNFLVIGAARCGTTTLHYSLGQHPEVFVSPIKEANFFLLDEHRQLPDWVSPAERERIPMSLDAYRGLFAQATDCHVALGETSPGYLFGPIARRIRTELPDAKLIAILRHPVDQALSIFTTWQEREFTTDQLVEGFVDSLASGHPGPDGALPLAQHGLFYRHLAPFYAQFDRRQIKVVLLDDLGRDTAGFFADLFRFLGVDDRFQLDEVPRYNGTGAPRNATIHNVLSGSARLKQIVRASLPEGLIRRLTGLHHRVRSANLRPISPLTSALRQQLTDTFYADDIAALEDLIGRDLASWHPKTCRRPAGDLSWTTAAE